jgi:hypothetical protein
MADPGNGNRPLTPVQAVSQIASNVTDSLKAQPVLLSLLLLNALFIAVIYFSVVQTRSHLHENMRMILDRCYPEKHV